jgi:hypothetical protein
MVQEARCRKPVLSCSELVSTYFAKDGTSASQHNRDSHDGSQHTTRSNDLVVVTTCYPSPSPGRQEQVTGPGPEALHMLQPAAENAATAAAATATVSIIH